MREIVWVVAVPADTPSSAEKISIHRQGNRPIDVEARPLVCDFRSPEDFLDMLERADLDT